MLLYNNVCMFGPSVMILVVDTVSTVMYTKEIVFIRDKRLSYIVSRLVGMQLLCCSCLLLLLAGGSSVVNGFTQVTGSAMITYTSQCGVKQDDPQLVAALQQRTVLKDAILLETNLV